jgi:hypothetical protein
MPPRRRQESAERATIAAHRRAPTISFRLLIHHAERDIRDNHVPDGCHSSSAGNVGTDKIHAGLLGRGLHNHGDEHNGSSNDFFSARYAFRRHLIIPGIERRRRTDSVSGRLATIVTLPLPSGV